MARLSSLRSRLGLGLVLALSVTATASARAATTGGAAPAMPTPVTGGWSSAGIVSAPGGPYLTDATGRKLQLHGVDLVAKCGGGAVPQRAAGRPCVGPAQGSQPAFVLSPSATDVGRRFTPADAAVLAGMGFNVVRLGIIWEGLEPGPAGVGPNDPTYCSPHPAGTPFPDLGPADPFSISVLNAYLRRVDVIVGELARQGIRVIIDMHQDAFGSAFSDAAGPTPWNGEGAPPWATCTNGHAFTAPPSWGAANRNPAVEAADHNFFANDVSGDLQGQFVRVWQAVARHYRANPDVLGYELLNEPADFSVARMDSELQCDYGGPIHEPVSCAASGAQAVPAGWIGAIQAADPDHVVFYEPPIYNDVDAPETIGIAEPLRFTDLAFAFHLYHPPSLITSLIESELARTRTDQPGGPPAIMDEFGGSRHSLGAGEDVAQADELGLSWSYWAALELHDPTGNPREYLLDASGRPVTAKARVLAVPYPFATAGTPGEESDNPATGHFRFTYVPDPAIHAPTEVAIPHYSYPHGYRASVSGARITSAAGAPILDLSAPRGSAKVTVTVVPN